MTRFADQFPIYIELIRNFENNPYAMEQSPSRKANRFKASQEIPHIFMEPEGSLPHSQVPATCPTPEPYQFSLYPHIPLPEDPS